MQIILSEEYKVLCNLLLDSYNCRPLSVDELITGKKFGFKQATPNVDKEVFLSNMYERLSNYDFNFSLDNIISHFLYYHPTIIDDINYVLDNISKGIRVYPRYDFSVLQRIFRQWLDNETLVFEPFEWYINPKTKTPNGVDMMLKFLMVYNMSCIAVEFVQNHYNEKYFEQIIFKDNNILNYLNFYKDNDNFKILLDLIEEKEEKLKTIKSESVGDN